MDSYATVGQLMSWLGLADDLPDPVNAASKLRSATILVALATNASPYDTPPAENVQALQDATCAQAAEWVRLGIEPGALPLGSGGVKRATILDATVERDTSGDTTRIDAAGRELCTEARDLLLAAGLLYVPGPLADDCDPVPTWGLDVARVSSGLPGVDVSPYSWGSGELSSWPFW